MGAGWGVTAADVARTGRTTTVAQWAVAVVVMIGSAASAGVGFGYLGEHPALGVITGLGVDLALACGLIIGRRLRAVGVTSTWGTVLSWLTGAMTLCLNSGAAALAGHWVLAIAHTFLPVLLVVLTEAGTEAHLKLHHLARAAAATEHTRHQQHAAAQRAAEQAQRQQLTAQQATHAELAQRLRCEEVRAAELTAAHHERQRADRRLAREHEARQQAVVLASVLTLATAWRARRTRTSQSRPGPTGTSRSGPAHGSQSGPRPGSRSGPTGRSQGRPTRVPVDVPAARAGGGVVVTEELLDRARRVRAARTARGLTAGRAVLQRELGVPERTAKELARRLTPLRVVTGGD